MPDIKISDLTAATAASGAMQLEVNDSLSSKRVTVDQLKDYVLPDGSVSSAKLATGAVTLTTKVTGVLPVTNGGSGVSTSTGSGNIVLSNSPTLVSPALGTPASGNLANCTFPTLNQNTTGTATTATNLSGGTVAATTITATGNITAYYSDDRLKTNLGNISNALSKVKQLNGFYYEANETAQSLGYEPIREVGVSAQQVLAILPEITAPAPIDNQYLTVHYERLVPLLIEAIKELSAQVDKLGGTNGT